MQRFLTNAAIYFVFLMIIARKDIPKIDAKKQETKQARLRKQATEDGTIVVAHLIQQREREVLTHYGRRWGDSSPFRLGIEFEIVYDCVFEFFILGVRHTCKRTFREKASSDTTLNVYYDKNNPRNYTFDGKGDLGVELKMSAKMHFKAFLLFLLVKFVWAAIWISIHIEEISAAMQEVGIIS